MGMTKTGEMRERYAALFNESDPRPSRWEAYEYFKWAERADSWAVGVVPISEGGRNV